MFVITPSISRRPKAATSRNDGAVVGQVGNLRRVGNPPEPLVNRPASAGCQPARRIPSCPTINVGYWASRRTKWQWAKARAPQRRTPSRSKLGQTLTSVNPKMNENSGLTGWPVDKLQPNGVYWLTY